MSAFRSATRFLIAFVLLLAAATASATQGPKAVQGRLALSAVPQSALAPQGERRTDLAP